MNTDVSTEKEPEFEDIRDYLRYHLRQVGKNVAVHIEVVAVIAILSLLFGAAFLTWWRRWTLPGSLQAYTVLVLPLTLLWLWLNRFRLVVPELDELNQQFTERSVIRYLMEGEREPPSRLFGPLALSCLFAVFTLWTGEPTLTALAFAATMLGIIAYRQGTHMLRVASFPLAFLFLLVPIPGKILDFFSFQAQTFLFKIAVNLLQIVGIEAEMVAEGNPIQVPALSPVYSFFGGQAGNGLPEAGLFILLTIWFLSLIEAPFRAKIGAVVSSLPLIALLLIGRIVLLCWLGTVDKDIVEIATLLTRWSLPIVGAGFQYIILRGLHCRNYHEWVSL